MTEEKKKRKDVYYEDDTKDVDWIAVAEESVKPAQEENAS